MPSNSTALPNTEVRNPASAHIDTLDALAMARLMNREDATVALAVAEALPQIAAVIERAATVLSGGERLFYMGAGTSGRLAVLDAVELLPTFGLESGRVIGLIAGGLRAMTEAVEGAEDDADAGARDLHAHGFGAGDMVIGVAASGGTPYVLGGLRLANEMGAAAAAIVCARNSPITALSPLTVEVITGPEVLTGSTRLKAGTAQKMVLNTISTCTLIKLGKSYGNLMVDVQPTNQKLRGRAARIVAEIGGLSTEEAVRLLEASQWQTKTAVVMALADVDADAARDRLARHGGRVREAVRG